MRRPSGGLGLSEVIHHPVDAADLESIASRLELPGVPPRRMSVCHLQPAALASRRTSRVSCRSSQPKPSAIPLHLGGGVCTAPSLVSPALLLPVEAETHAFLEGAMEVPNWWVCAGPRGCFLVPTLVLLGLSIGLVVLNWETSAWWYPLLYAAVALLGPLATWASTGLLLQLQLQRLQCHGAVAGADLGPIVAFIRHTAHLTTSTADIPITPKQEPPRNPEDPLDFLRHDIMEWSASTDGWVVIDTTGIILWCNEAVVKYFGYERDQLIQRNVRILMPQPYAAEHDFFIRRQIKSGACTILGNPAGRPVPVVNRQGEQSMAVLSIHDHLDPHNIANYVFSGRMRFGLQDAALIKVKAKVAQGGDIALACKVMDAEPLTRIVSDARGTILYVNAATSRLFGWSRQELVGRSVKCLMGELTGSNHDKYLASYIRRAQAVAGTARVVKSNIVRSGRDVMARTKDHQNIRVFLTVERIDPRSGNPAECFFHATIVPTTEVDRSRSGSYCGQMRRSLIAASSRAPPALRPALKSVQPRLCSVVMVAAHGLCCAERWTIQQAYDEALNIITERVQAHRGVLQCIVGDCFVLVFNHSSQPNSSHRSSAAHFLMELHQKWQYSILYRSLWLQTAAVCRSAYMAQLDAQQLLLSDSMDACFCALRVAAEAQVQRPVIDGSLYQELMYSWTCRLLNVATLRHFKQQPSTMEVYELIEQRKMATDEEWMYQITGVDEVDPWMYWASCWEELRGPHPDCAAALGLLQSHLKTHPSDAPALWLQEVLQQGVPLEVEEMAGTLSFSLLCHRNDRRPSHTSLPAAPHTPPSAPSLQGFRMLLPSRTGDRGPPPSM